MKFLEVTKCYLGSVVDEMKKVIGWMMSFEPGANLALASLPNLNPERNEYVQPIQTLTGEESVK